MDEEMSPRGGGVRLKEMHGGALRLSTGKLKGKAEVSGNVWRYLGFTDELSFLGPARSCLKSMLILPE